MAAEWMHRRDAAMPYATWRPFPSDAIVQIRNAFGESNIGPAGDFWWGYATELGEISEGVIIAARRLDKPKRMNHDH